MRSVLVGMSGGVDSSVSAALLKEQGFCVVGGFIKNWSDSKDLWTGECNWLGERRDALRVAARLGIPLLTFDFEEDYRRLVIDELFRGYAAGETPNPDILCNEAIKFGLFYEQAKKLGIDYIATGHYARVVNSEQCAVSGKDSAVHCSPSTVHLLRGVDPEKDQSYFLYRVSQEALSRTIFPIGHLRKSEVRQLAKKFDLPVAEKPDSQGICFVGKLDFSGFLRQRIASKPGDVVDAEGRVLGQHQGLDQYTIGQRQRIGVARGGHAWYVADKDMQNNQLVVVSNPDHPLLCSKEANLHDFHWISGAAPESPFNVEVQVRYRQPAVAAQLTGSHLEFCQPVRAVAPGQSAVFYQGDECLGGGIISKSKRVLPRLAPFAAGACAAR